MRTARLKLCRLVVLSVSPRAGPKYITAYDSDCGVTPRKHEDESRAGTESGEGGENEEDGGRREGFRDTAVC